MSDAVCVSAPNWFILDSDYRIVAAKTTAGTVEEHIGVILWELFPEAESIYAELFGTAWATGNANAHAFHLGRLVHVVADRISVGLLVTYRILARIDTTTLSGLSQSLDLLADLLARAEPGSGRPSRTALQIVRPTPAGQ